MTLIKELIDIPEKVQRGDLVLNLATGLEPAAVKQILRNYVVTPQLARSFEDALSYGPQCSHLQCADPPWTCAG